MRQDGGSGVRIRRTRARARRQTADRGCDRSTRTRAARAAAALDRDDIYVSSNRHLDLLLAEHDLFRKPASTFRDLAL